MRGLYLHVPFCSVKCFYCDFTAFSGQRALVDRTIAAMAREMDRYRLPVDTLYIGGGTPSELTAGELERLLSEVSSRYGAIEDLREFTFEANPESLGAEKLEVLAAFGATRVSLGLQTAEPRLLKELGRRHSSQDFIDAFKATRAAGIAVNVDLMTGLPGQTLENAQRSLETVLALKPEHLSVYGLKVEDRTLFSKRGVEVDEDLDRIMYERTLERVAQAGYRHYEISNFALPGHESVHNQIYWRNEEYIGIGCGASGYLGGVRYRNHDRLTDYCDAVERGDLARGEQELLCGKRAQGEKLLLGLRLMDGVDLSETAAFSQELDAVEKKGLLERRGGRARLTRDGLFFANQVFAEFVAPFRSGEL